ncbi:related to heterokaryon incompatibility protein [Fusarium fujikuroi IMI 58289]|uniref:Related to heterokaryon incompatibility protein n=1 Tax=Gibberella fujikuroi (strain CBS 195.34 / IMI 58289 / NRRL A-6831) TaxID=1279085 RepID=S0DRK6_GIBF5|nr:related to heterokaryon incompatibility protein [Fusarium fujikuroi IMI 58289]CCT63193.1 related to heterokaryon incompatibility protein [Fusarium fujikuroi IMI 58289]SCN71593.1 related to heterokaryon incompatibility protein [Fusarium fujikuroi]
MPLRSHLFPGRFTVFEDDDPYIWDQRLREEWWDDMRMSGRHFRRQLRLLSKWRGEPPSLLPDQSPSSQDPDMNLPPSSGAAKLQILSALKRAKDLKLCLRRIWAVAASLPDRENSLPALIPLSDTFSIPGHDRERHEHEQCTFDFCEQSRVDFTSVIQRHEPPCNGECKKILFPLQQLDEQVTSGQPTAWKANEPSLLEASKPYMAVSHVWSDGTGSGIWGPGQVNKCLYDLFGEIAQSFQCEGCWWDTISIPLEDKARSRALGNMHSNYNNSRITLIHDLYLRQWEWIDAETACFAIVMSPWYSRGWTALELAQSHKVKILFKENNNTRVIKDLDVDILDKAPENHATANAIRKLRHASIDDFGTLLAILGARDTSKPRDVPIISGLLAGVDVSGRLSQQEIYQRILRKLGGIAQGHLFHNSATMSAPGFSWCPTNILDMPMAQTDSAPLRIWENGDIEGVWRVQAIDTVKVEDLIMRGTHPLTQVALELAFGGESMKKHILLLETCQPKSTSNEHRALLVRIMESNGEIQAKVVGPVYFRTGPDSHKESSKKSPQVNVRIGSTDGLKDVTGSAWDYVQKRIFEMNSSRNEIATGHVRTSTKPGASATEEFTLPQNQKAIFFSKEVSLDELFDKGLQQPPNPRSYESESADETAMYFYSVAKETDTPPRALFYGNKGLVKESRNWLKNPENSNIAETKSVLLTVGDDRQLQIDHEREDCEALKKELAGEALLCAVEIGGDTNVSMKAMITLLLDIKASHNRNGSGQRPLEVAIERMSWEIAQTLLEHELNSAPVDLTTLELATRYQDKPSTLSRLLVQRCKDVNENDKMQQRTAWHYATERGDRSMIEALLGAEQANPYTPDNKGKLAIHYAASKGKDNILRLLLQHAKTESLRKDTPVGESEDKANSTGTTENGTSNNDIRNTRPQESRYVDMRDSKGQTPLHLAAKAGYKPAVSTLLEFGANSNSKSSDGQTPLLLAVERKHSQIVKYLLDSDKGNYEGEELDDALFIAASGKDEEVIKKLYEKGARYKRGLVTDGKTALHWAIHMGHETSAELLVNDLEDEDVDVEDPTKQQSALLMASEKGMTSVVELLLAKHANIELLDSDKRTALHLAAMGPHLETIKKLLKSSKCPVNKQDRQKRTPLHWAALKGSTGAIELLAKQEYCNTTFTDESGRTALVIAAEMGLHGIVELLLQGGSGAEEALNGAASNGRKEVVQKILPKIEKDDVKHRALELGARAGHVSVSVTLNDSIKDSNLKASTFRMILFAAAAHPSQFDFDDLKNRIEDPTIQDDKKQSLLMVAIANGHTRLVKHLCSLHDVVELRDIEGRTALMIAALNNDGRSVRLLLNQGADPYVQDNKGRTALHHAIENECFNSFAGLLAFSDRQLRTIQDSENRTVVQISLEKARQWELSTQDARLKLSRLETLTSMCVFLIRRGIQPEIRDKNKRNALHLAVSYDLAEIAYHLLQSRQSGPRVSNLDTQDVEGRTPLLLAASKGYYFLIELMLSEGFEPNTRDATDETPLLLASERGNFRAVEALLEHNADPNVRNTHGRTALSQAAQNGYDRLVRCLVDNSERKVELNTQDNMGQTALILAAENGHEDIVNFLVDQNANADITGYDGKKAWQKAVDKGHASVVETLLSKTISPVRDRQAVNEALLLASRRGWGDLVGVLLKQEVDLTFQSKGEELTALHMAAMNGHQEVLSKLTAKGVEIVIKDLNGRTALFLATEQGFPSIVRLLLERMEIKSDLEAWMGKESLLFAAGKGYDEIVDLLLKSGVDCNATDESDKSAMALAAANGKEVIVQSTYLLSRCPHQLLFIFNSCYIIIFPLLSYGLLTNRQLVAVLLKRGASWSIKDRNQRTALHHAAWGGHHRIVESILNYKPATVNENSGVGTVFHETVVPKVEVRVDSGGADNLGQSALHLAAERASVMTVQKLVRHYVNVNARCEDGQTVLHRAAWGGSREVVDLLRRSGADPFIRDNQGKKPWHIAAEKGHQDIAVELLKEELDVADDCILDQKGLIFAARMGYTDIALTLLKLNAESNVKDERKRTPLHWAASRGDDKLTEELIAHGEVLINALDHERRTALCLAIRNGCTTTVKILLQKGINPNIPDSERQTALHHAAQRGNEEITQILLDHNADPHIYDNNHVRPWQLAADKGYHQVVRLLLTKEINLCKKVQRREEVFLKMVKQDLVPMVQLFLGLEVDKDVKDPFGRTAIALAAKHGSSNVLRLLLSNDADLSIADSRRQTAFLWAAEAKDTKILSLLVDKIKSDQNLNTEQRQEIVNHQDAKGMTALLIAIERDNDKVVKLLLEKCGEFINVNIPDATERTALQLAAETGKDNWVQLLLKRQADAGLKDSFGRTALLLAVEQGHMEVVKTLLKASENHVDDADKQNRTPLHAATYLGNQDMVKALLEGKANPLMKDDRQRLALLLAAENGDEAIVRLLLESHNHPPDESQECKDQDGRTPLLLAVANGHRAVVERLLEHFGADFTIERETGNRLLQLAVESGNKDVVLLVAQRLPKVE